MNLNILFFFSVIVGGALLSLAIDWRPAHNGLVIRDEIIGWAIGAVVVVIAIFIYKRRVKGLKKEKEEQ